MGASRTSTALAGMGAALIASVVACSATDVRAPEGETPASSGEGVAVVEPIPELRKVVVDEVVPPWAPAERELAFVLPFDYGIRADSGGQGAFLAPRAHGRHNGIDLLAPVGTPVLAACSGQAKSDDRGGYGNVVQLVCRLPKNLGGDEGLFASFFYAHLDKTAVPRKWTHVKAEVKLGTVGKTGNAKGPKITPHLHFEVIVRGSEADALEERHAGVAPAANVAADRFFELLDDACIGPAKFTATAGAIRRERRADPFVLLMCTAKPKPDLESPRDAKLASAQVKWSDHYAARGFDVNRGPR